MADLSSNFEVVQRMRAAPFTLQTVVQLAGITLVPVVPLVLTTIPLKEVLQRLIKIVL